MPFGLASLFQTVQWICVCQNRHFGLNDADRYSGVISHKMNMDTSFPQFGRVRQVLVLQFNQFDVLSVFRLGFVSDMLWLPFRSRT